MHESDTPELEGSPTVAGLAPQAARLAAAPDCRGPGRQRSRHQPVDEASAARWSDGLTAPATTRRTPSAGPRAAGASARAVTGWPGSLWLPRPSLDPKTRGRSDTGGVWRGVPPHPCGPPPQSAPLEPPEADAPGSTARRSRHCAVARRDLAGHQKGAEAQQQRIFFIDESGFSPLPSVVRTYAPVGQTPVLREWYTRDHLSAISALSPAGKLYFRAQDHAMNSADVVAFLEHLLREVPGRMVVIWDGAPIHRSQLIKAFLANGAARRLHVERLPAYAPELNPGEGLWEQLKGVELRNVCCFTLPHLRHELRDAVKRVRRKPRVLHGFFRGAK